MRFPAISPHLVYVVPFPTFLLFCDFFPELSAFSVAKMKSDIVFSRAQAAILRSSGHSVKEIAKFFNKTECWVSKWLKRECFEDKPRSGRPSVWTNCARKSIEKAKYKRNNSTRKIAKSLQQKNITVWRYMTRKGWKAFKRKKIPLLSEKQRPESPFEIRQEIREPDSRRLGQFFYLQMSVLNIFFITLIQKTISYGARRNVMFLQLSSEAKCEGDGVGWHDRLWAHKVTHATHKPNLNF